MNCNDFILNLFTGTDDSRPALLFPSLEDGTVYASDSNVMIAIPEDELILKYEKRGGFPNCKKLLADTEEKELTKIKVNVSDLAGELARARLVVDKHLFRCESCEGVGCVEWEFRDTKGKMHANYDTCPVCDGEGKDSRGSMFPRISLEMREDPNNGKAAVINIGQMCFHPFQLYRLFMVAVFKRLEVFEIAYNVGPRFSSMIAHFDNIQVVVAGYIPEPPED